MSDERRSYLLDVTDNLLSVHANWLDADTPYFTEELEKATLETIEVFGLGDIPGDLRDLARVVDELAAQWEKFRQAAEVSRDPHLLPRDGFWKQIEMMRDLREAARPKPTVELETIEQLEKQNVSDRQICLIYGWVNGDGSPQFDKLREERKKPGTHINDDFIPPRERTRRQQEARQREIVEAIRAKQRKKLAVLTTPAKEAWPVLFEQGLSAKQLAKMKKVSLDDVYAKAVELGYPKPPLDYDLRTPAPKKPDEKPTSEAHDEPEQPEPTRNKGGRPKGSGKAKAQPRTPPKPLPRRKMPDDEPEPLETDIGTLESEIQTYVEAGMEPEGIAAAVSSPDAPVTVQQVQQILRKAKQGVGA